MATRVNDRRITISLLFLVPTYLIAWAIFVNGETKPREAILGVGVVLGALATHLAYYAKEIVAALRGSKKRATSSAPQIEPPRDS